MKDEIVSLDLMFLAREMKDKILSGKIRGIKQTNRTFVFEIYKGEKFFLKAVLGKAIYTTKNPQKSEKPTSFTMQLRKHLLNKKISSFCQIEFDRIIEMESDGYRVIFELFGKGNLILTDSSGKIIGVLEHHVWKGRTLKPNAIYKYPPSNINPFNYDRDQLQKILMSMNKEIVKVFASNLGFGGAYAEEFCKMMKIDKNKLATQLDQKEFDRIYKFIEELKIKKPKSFIYEDKENRIDLTPIEMDSYKNYNRVEFESFEKAAETYFEYMEKMKKSEEESKDRLKEENKQRKILEKQRIQLEDIQKKELDYRNNAKLLYENYQVISDILNLIDSLKQKKLNWQKIKEEMKKQKNVKGVDPNNAKIIIKIDGFEVDLDFRKTLEENANIFFEQAKKLKRKIDGLNQAMKKFEIPKIEEKKVEERQWYENFRWFTSSDGFLIIAGKDSKTNETIVKKHVRDHDLVFHADIRGAPFVVIRNDKNLEIPLKTTEEAGEFAASHSRAWKLKMANVDVSYMKPQNIYKGPQMPEGTFGVKERKVLKKISLKISIGVTKELKIVSGPTSIVKNQTPYLVTIVPGNKSSEELAKEIKDQFLTTVPNEIKDDVAAINPEEIKRHIPFGIGELVV